MAFPEPRIGTRAIAVVATLLALIVLLAAGSLDPDLGLRSRMHEALQDYEFADAELTRDVLRARAGMAANYDALGQDRRALQTALAQLREVAHSGSARAREALREHIDRMSGVQASELDSVERFKSAVALQRNSVQFLVTTAADQAEIAGGPRARAQAERLVQHVLRTLEAPAGSEWDRAGARAAESGTLPEAYRALPETHRAHARMALAQRGASQALLRAILAAPARADAGALRAAVLALSNQAETRSSRYRDGLAFVSLVLLAYIVVQVREVRRLDAQRRAQELELIEASRMSMVGLLSSGVAHEIGHFSQVVVTSAPFVADAFRDATLALEEARAASGAARSDPLPDLAGLPWEEARREVAVRAGDMRDSAHRASRMAEDVKRLARTGAPTTRGLDDESFDVGDSVERVARLLRDRFRNGAARLELMLEGGLPRARGNAQHFEHVLLNLVANGLDALARPGGAVRVGARASEGGVQVTVQDEGIGIAPANLARLGQPFFTTRHDRGGTGLGLMIAFANVARLGASLRFESSPGSGTSAIVALRVNEPGAVGAAPRT